MPIQPVNALSIACGAALLLLCGCRPGPIVPDAIELDPIEGKMPPIFYSNLASRYNYNAQALGRLWARTRVELIYRDDKDRRRVETGEGKLIYVRPMRTALTVGKLGKTVMWAGSDQQRFWMFDLQDDKAAFVGSHDRVRDPCAQPLPLPIRPADVPLLLGITPIETDERKVSLGQSGGYAVVELREPRLRLTLDPATARAVQAELIDADGNPLIVSRLSGHRPVEVEGIPRPKWPLMATEAVVYVTGTEARMTLSISGAGDGARRNRIKDKVFDFDALVVAHKPATIIDLDRGCE